MPRKPAKRRKPPDRRKTSATAWVLGAALPGERRVGSERRVNLKDRRRHI